MSNRVEVCSPEEAARYIKMLGGEEALTNREGMLKGFVDIVCREADGSVAWEVHQPNIITDAGRRKWVAGLFYYMYVFTSPCADTPIIGRTTFFDDGDASSAQVSSQLTSSYDSPSLTRTWTTPQFGAPAKNRQIGIVGLSDEAKPTQGVHRVLAYTRVTPTRTQTTTQTLEVVYKVTLNPSY